MCRLQAHTHHLAACCYTDPPVKDRVEAGKIQEFLPPTNHPWCLIFTTVFVHDVFNTPEVNETQYKQVGRYLYSLVYTVFTPKPGSTCMDNSCAFLTQHEIHEIDVIQ